MKLLIYLPIKKKHLNRGLNLQVVAIMGEHPCGTSLESTAVAIEGKAFCSSKAPKKKRLPELPKCNMNSTAKIFQEFLQAHSFPRQHAFLSCSARFFS